jgi:type II secretory pathway pseudopilin PulG
MNLPKRLIHLVGIVGVLGVFIAGIMLVALPVYLGSVDVLAEQKNVADSNSLRMAQIEALKSQLDRLPEVQSELAGLRQQIPASPLLDEVSQLGVAAAQDAGVELGSITSAGVSTFVPPAGTAVAGIEAAAAGAGGDAGTTVAEGTAGDSEPAEDKLQIDITFVVSTGDKSRIPEFVDGLREGPRLLQIVGVTTTAMESNAADGSSGATTYQATVATLAFVQQ